jgi:hypothetical protein
MFQSLAQGIGIVGVFKELDEACAWLGVLPPAGTKK